MRVCQDWRCWVWWAVAVLACGDGASAALMDSTGRGDERESRSADAADVDSRSRGSSDAESCGDSSNASSMALQAAIDEADQRCTADADCDTAYLNTDCFHGCGVAVSVTAKQALDAASSEQNRTTCQGFEARGCVAVIPPCVAPGVAACIGGECTEFQSYEPSNADAGSPTSPLALKVDASGTSVQLAVGQRLEVTLGTIGGDSWGEPRLSSAALRFVQGFLPRRQNPGGPTTVFVFQAISAGRVELTIPHTTRASFTLTVTVH